MLEIREMHELRDENTRLKRLVADDHVVRRTVRYLRLGETPAAIRGKDRFDNVSGLVEGQEFVFVETFAWRRIERTSG